MTKNEYKKYLKSDHWVKTRRQRKRLDNNRCYLCGCPKYLNVHHLKYDNLGDENVEEDLVTLCRKCHLMLHRIKDATQAEYETYIYEKRRNSNKQSQAFAALQKRLKEKIIEQMWFRDKNFGGDLKIFNGNMKPVKRLLRIVKILYPDIHEFDISREVLKEIKKITF